MVKCKALETCFYGGKRRRVGKVFSFDGSAKDLPKYLEQIKKPEKEKA